MTLLSLSQRSLALFHARWSTGSLLALTPQEVAFFFRGGAVREAQLVMVHKYISCANDALSYWPPLHNEAEDAARVHGIYAALRMALEVDAQGLALLGASSEAAREFTSSLRDFLGPSLVSSMLRRLRATCGLTHDEEAALRRLVQRADACAPHEKALTELRRKRRGGCASRARRRRRGTPRPAPLRAAGVRRNGAPPQGVQAVRPLPRRRVLQRGAPAGGLAPPQM